MGRFSETPRPAGTEVSIRAPTKGTVLERLVTEGQYVSTGDVLFRVADLSKLWVELDADETELDRFEPGDEVKLRVPSTPGRTLQGKVSFVEPTVDPRTRIARLRVEVDNTSGELRPGMQVEAWVDGDPIEEPQIILPQSAVLFTGRRSLVYIELPEAPRPTYVPREVELGPILVEGYVIREGLQVGERVVMEGAFVLDADLQIRGGASAMTRRQAPSPEWKVLVEAYVDLQEALAADDLESAKQATLPAIDAAKALKADALEAAIASMASSNDLENARAFFETASARVLDELEIRGNPLSIPLRETFCPMVGLDRGGSWLQTGAKIDNPYFGSQMRRCGEFRSVLAPGELR